MGSCGVRPLRANCGNPAIAIFTSTIVMAGLVPAIHCAADLKKKVSAGIAIRAIRLLPKVLRDGFRALCPE